ncbi:hypothetical protein [Absidia glauca]|uniref:Integrase catalytic domain-containing protein n=1 Tax=Absidia glauca TaxID=4829 RepID=A0A168LWM0_ABSGL|nr:hypothetical protein [Absidia glauca]
MDEVKNKQALDPFIKSLKAEVKLPMVWHKGLLCYKKKDGAIVLVLPRSLIHETIHKYHGGPSGGHFGIEKTTDKIQDTQRYHGTSHETNSSTLLYTGGIWASDIASIPLSKKGNRYILVFMEYLSKWVIAVALPGCTTDIVAQVLMFEVVLKMGVPNRLITDNGSNYVSEAMKMICTRLGIKRSLTSVEHPQSDGLVERINRTLKISLAAFTGIQEKDRWDDYLPFVTFAYNTATQSSTGYSPFELLYGKKATLPLVDGLEMDPKTHESETWKAYLDHHLPMIHGKAIINIQKAQDRQKWYYDKTKAAKYHYKIGDLVARKNLDKMAFPKERWTGPWIIVRQTNSDGSAFLIRHPDKASRTTTTNIRHFRPGIQATTTATFECSLEGGDDVAGVL